MKGKSAFEVSSLLQGPNETFVTFEVVIKWILVSLCSFS